MTDQAKTIFVFYTFADSSVECSWTYNALPKSWWWVGSGSTGSQKYQQEEQFQGPKKTQDKTAQYLDKVFSALKKKGMIKVFKIRRSYLP
jgi:hypothetical protein